jgi:hypothetical protein
MPSPVWRPLSVAFWIEHISLKVVDHAFWRAAQLLAPILVALFVALVAVVLALRRPAQVPGGQRPSLTR